MQNAIADPNRTVFPTPVPTTQNDWDHRRLYKEDYGF
jgi:hypothetical protein